MAAEGGEAEAPASFRCIDVARYAVASVVTVLMVVVVVKAKLLLRPHALYLSVPGGSLLMTPVVLGEVKLDFTIRAQNPSGRASLYYVDITGYIFVDTLESAESSDPKNDSIVYFELDDMFLPQSSEQLRSMAVRLRGLNKPESYFEALYSAVGRNLIDDVTLRLDGRLIMQPVSSFNTTPKGTTFYCRPLFISGNLGVDDASMNKQEAFCVSGAGKTVPAEQHMHNR